MCFGLRITFALGLKARDLKPGCTQASVNFSHQLKFLSLLKA